MKLSTLAVVLGLGYALFHLWGLIKPAGFKEALRKFPRSERWGYVLMGLGTAWFLWNLKKESIADFESYKRVMLIGFAAAGVGTCIYVKDYLAVRGLAVVLLLMAKLVVDTARWVETPWRWVLVLWAYQWVFFGIWLTISPWRLRDFIAWVSENDRRLKTVVAVRLIAGLFLLVLGLAVFP